MPHPRWIPRRRPRLCASLRSRNAHGHVTGAILRQNLPVKFTQTRYISQKPFYARIYKVKCRRPRQRPTLRASLRTRHAYGHVTRVILCENLQEKCRAPNGSPDRDPHFVRACAIEMHMDMSQEPSYTRIYRENAAPKMDPETATHTLCEPAQSKCTWTCHRRSHFIMRKNYWENAAPQMDPETATHTSREPAKRTWTCRRGHLMREFTGPGKCRAPNGSPDRDPHFARACAVEMHMGKTQGPFCARMYRN